MQKLVEQGMKSHEIAAILGIHVKTVGKARKFLGISSPYYPKYSQEIRLRAAEMLDEGMSFQGVSEALGPSDTTIRNWFPDRGWSRAQISEQAALGRKFARIVTGGLR